MSVYIDIYLQYVLFHVYLYTHSWILWETWWSRYLEHNEPFISMYGSMVSDKPRRTRPKPVRHYHREGKCCWNIVVQCSYLAGHCSGGLHGDSGLCSDPLWFGVMTSVAYYRLWMLQDNRALDRGDVELGSGVWIPLVSQRGEVLSKDVSISFKLRFRWDSPLKEGSRNMIVVYSSVSPVYNKFSLHTNITCCCFSWEITVMGDKIPVIHLDNTSSVKPETNFTSVPRLS